MGGVDLQHRLETSRPHTQSPRDRGGHPVITQKDAHTLSPATCPPVICMF